MGLFSRSDRPQVHAVAARGVEEALAGSDPWIRLRRPEWGEALRAAGIDAEAIVFATDGDHGTIEVRDRRVLIDRGVLLVTRAQVVYAYCDGERVTVVARPLTALLDLRNSKEKRHFYVVFAGDTYFQGRRDLVRDHWRIHSPERADEPGAGDHATVLAGFRAAGVPC